MTYFECGWILLIIKNFLRIANNINISERADDFFSIVILILFVISLFSKRYKKREVVIYGCLGFAAIYTGLVTGYMIITTTTLSILAAKDEDLIKIAKITFAVQIALLMTNTLYSIFLYIIEKGELWGVYEDGQRFRVHLGYGMAGHLADLILNLIIIWIFLKNGQIKKIDYIMIIVINIFTYLLTDSRTVFILSFTLLCLLWMINKQNKYLIATIRRLTAIIIPILTLIMFNLIHSYGNGNSLAIMADEIFNSRVRLCGYNLERYGMTLFGQFCENLPGPVSYKWMSNGQTYDNVYMWLIINMGLIWIIILSIAFFRIYRNGNTVYCLYMIIWALGAFMDTDFLNSACFFIIILLSKIIIDRKVKHSLAVPKITKRVSCIKNNFQGENLIGF